MAPPPKEKIVAAVAALRADAEVWLNNHNELRTARAFEASVHLESRDFSHFGEQAGLPPVYFDLHDKVSVLITEGGDHFYSIMAALREAADGYERDEAMAVHELTGIW
jgi:hypothetical protein